MSLANKNALPQVIALKSRIENITSKGYAFGHQDTTSYGIGWSNDAVNYQSDVYSVAGDFPLVYGFDLGRIEHDNSLNLDGVPFDEMKMLIQKAHRDGGIITISWHADNPVSKGDSWDTTPAVKQLLDGGDYALIYKSWIKRIADFMLSLKDDEGELIPIAFRPLHEMNGFWFWWGNPNCSPEEFKALWRHTFDLLTKDFMASNLLFIYAPNMIGNAEEYLVNYPGDEYVDMLGLDMYQHGSSKVFKKDLKKNLEVLKQVANEKMLPFALTEVGLEKVEDTNWWTTVLDEILENSGISWVLLWRNHTTSHFYVPYPNQLSVADFIAFKNKSHVLFLNDVK